MRVAALYDIHGNLPALEAVLEDVRRLDVDLIVIGGDVVPGPMPREAMDCLLSLDVPVRFIRGNGDRETLALMNGAATNGKLPESARIALRWSADQLAPEHARAVAAWPLTTSVQIGALGDVLFCHATPRNDTDIFTKLTPEDRVRTTLDGVTASLVVCGHTHMQFDRTVGATRVVNAGSVGMPFQGTGAYWLLLGPDVRLRHTPYDLADAAARIRRTAYPQAEAFAAQNVLQTPSETAILEAFAKVELT